jgi:hypothetical protein
MFELAARVSGHVLPLPATITDSFQWNQISDRNDRSFGVEVITVMAFSSTHALLWPRKHREKPRLCFNRRSAAGLHFRNLNAQKVLRVVFAPDHSRADTDQRSLSLSGTSIALMT